MIVRNLKAQGQLSRHVDALLTCTRCPKMHKPVVSGGAVLSRVILVGQAPGDKEPILGRPFAWTAGRKLFRWFNEHTGVDELTFRSHIYMAAVCRCFPGKRPVIGGDRVPDPTEIHNCSGWLQAEMKLLQPGLVIAVGKLAIQQFMPCGKLDEVIGRPFPITYARHRFDLVPISCFAAAGACVLVLRRWITKKAPVSPLENLYANFCHNMARRGIPRAAWEGPLAYTDRVAEAFPDDEQHIHRVGNIVAHARYGPTPPDPADLGKLESLLQLLTASQAAAASRDRS